MDEWRKNKTKQFALVSPTPCYAVIAVSEYAWPSVILHGVSVIPNKWGRLLGSLLRAFGVGSQCFNHSATRIHNQIQLHTYIVTWSYTPHPQTPYERWAHHATPRSHPIYNINFSHKELKVSAIEEMNYAWFTVSKSGFSQTLFFTSRLPFLKEKIPGGWRASDD